MVAVLLLGSNKGDRAAHLRRAAAAIAAWPRTRLIKASRVRESAAEPAGSGPPFLNQALRIRTTLTPMGLLIECKRLEAFAGRRPGRRLAPRTLDVDILIIVGRSIRTPWLEVPHPLLRSRRFALIPAGEVGGGPSA